MTLLFTPLKRMKGTNGKKKLCSLEMFDNKILRSFIFCMGVKVPWMKKINVLNMRRKKNEIEKDSKKKKLDLMSLVVFNMLETFMKTWVMLAYRSNLLSRFL